MLKPVVLALVLALAPLAARADDPPPAPVSKPAAPPAVQGEAKASRHGLALPGGSLDYTAEIGTVIVSTEDRQRRGEMFYVAYRREAPAAPAPAAPRPLAFVVNGGPGAASAYLHLGALGPKTLRFAEGGGAPPPPGRLEANPETWLRFADLVFIDPVGTGFSRGLKAEAKEGEPPHDERDDSFWSVEADLRALAEFIRLYLTRHERWGAPVFLVGESYGGFRVAALAEQLPEAIGLAPAGVVMVSPVLEFSLLNGDSYQPMHWVTLLPSYAAIAAARRGGAIDWQAEAKAAEAFATGSYLNLLVAPKPVPELEDGPAEAEESAEQQAAWARLAALTGLPEPLVRQHQGRVPRGVFAKAMADAPGRVLSLYDGLVTAPDPRPAEAVARGPDPLLAALTAPLTTAMAAYVRDELGYRTETAYRLLARDVGRRWNWRSGRGQGYAGVADDLKQAMSLRPDLKLLIVHGRFDLITPYYASTYVIDRMALPSSLRRNVAIRTYTGGHMFYSHREGRAVFARDAERFFAATLAAKDAPSR